MHYDKEKTVGVIALASWMTVLDTHQQVLDPL